MAALTVMFSRDFQTSIFDNKQEQKSSEKLLDVYFNISSPFLSKGPAVLVRSRTPFKRNVCPAALCSAASSVNRPYCLHASLRQRPQGKYIQVNIYTVVGALAVTRVSGDAYRTTSARTGLLATQLACMYKEGT